jgi:predicted dehydrogenase
MDKVRFGIIGVGGMGSHHGAYLKAGEIKRAELTAVCDVDEGKLTRWEGIPQFTDSAQLIRSGLVDAVIVATPHYFHTTIGIDAMQQGLHLLTEKPISVHKADCQRMIDAHKGTDLVFGAMFQCRTDPINIKLKKLLDAGVVGEISRINWIITDWFRTEAYYASGGWRATWSGEGGGVLLNQCPHNLDLMQWFFGMPSKVRAFCKFGAKHDIEVEDQVTAYLEYPNGATGMFITTTGEAPGTNRLEIAGENGRLVAENGKITFVRNEVPMTEFSRTTNKGFAVPDKWFIDIPFGGPPCKHQNITQGFVNAVLDGTPLIAEASDGIRSVELANCMLYSTWTDTTVELPLDAAAYESAIKEKCATSKFRKKTAKDREEDITTSFK